MKLCFWVGVLALVANNALAQQWPQRPVKIVVPFAAGGNTDGIARISAERLSQALGQQFVVENRVGAQGQIAADYVAKSSPDGYTFLMAASAQIVIVPAMTKTPYDPIKDFAPISIVGTNPFVLGVHQSVPAKNVREFVEFIRANPGKYNYASGGSGSLSHLSAALFLKQAGLEMTHVPYKGGAPAVADLVGGQVQMYFGNFSEFVQHAASGRVRLLGVSSDKRNVQAPDLPTIAEQGYPGFRTITWNGLLAPAGTEPAIIERTAQEIAKAARDPAVIKRLQGLGVDALGNTPQEFAEVIRQETPFWAEVVKISGAKLE